MKMPVLMRTVAGIFTLAVKMAPGGLGAQATGHAAVDSSTVARTAWSAAAQAARAGDLAAAQRELARAAVAWPTQQSYVWNLAVIAARRLDTATVARALRDYAGLGLGRDLRDTVFAPFRDAAWFGPLSAAHDANRAPIARSRVRLELSDSTQWPEGVDYDARTGNFYVTSIRHRTVVEVGPDGRERDVLRRGTGGIGAVFAVRLDSPRDLLWITTSSVAPGDSALAALVAVRVSDGATVRRFDLPRSTRHTLGDVAIGPDGDVFVSDSDDPVLYRLRPGADTLEAIRHPLFRSLQGVAPAADGRAVYAADYSHGILRVDLRTGNVTRVSDAANSTSLGCDGLVWHRGALIAVQNGVAPARVMRFHLDPTGARITRAELLDRNFAIADEPTVGTIAGAEFVYVANSQWEKHAPDGSRRPGVPLTRPILLGLRIPQ
jgi:sugar lactone lactonase YvrE